MFDCLRCCNLSIESIDFKIRRTGTSSADRHCARSRRTDLTRLDASTVTSRSCGTSTHCSAVRCFTRSRVTDHPIIRSQWFFCLIAFPVTALIVDICHTTDTFSWVYHIMEESSPQAKCVSSPRLPERIPCQRGARDRTAMKGRRGVSRQEIHPAAREHVTNVVMAAPALDDRETRGNGDVTTNTTTRSHAAGSCIRCQAELLPSFASFQLSLLVKSNRRKRRHLILHANRSILRVFVKHVTLSGVGIQNASILLVTHIDADIYVL